MRIKPNQMTIFDWMLLIVVAAFAAQFAKLGWQLWLAWPQMNKLSIDHYELLHDFATRGFALGAVAAGAAVIIFFRNWWHRRKSNF